MAVLYGVNQTALNAGTTLAPGKTAGTVRVHTEIVTFAGQTTADTIVVWKRPKGSIFLGGVINNSASTATATVAIGVAGSTGKYRAAAAKTTTVPEVFGETAAMNVATTAEEEVYITIGTAALPASGTMALTFLYAQD